MRVTQNFLGRLTLVLWEEPVIIVGGREVWDNKKWWLLVLGS